MSESSKEKFIDDCGRVVLKTKGLMNLIKDGKNIDGLIAEDNYEARLYNKNLSSKGNLVLYDEEMKTQNQDDFDQIHTLTWKTPKDYKDLNLYEFLINKCTNQDEIDRVNYEYELYRERGLIPLLLHLIYLIDHFRQNEIVWGVGRGSSVSSYVLYLIGVHKVNSIKYNLDIKEFLR